VSKRAAHISTGLDRPAQLYTMTTLIQQITQFILAIAGVVSCAIWYRKEAYRSRMAPVILGAWCFLLIIFRAARWIYPQTIPSETALGFNALANTLFMLGAAGAIAIAAANITEAGKHGHC
jgi:hypothetical protein